MKEIIVTWATRVQRVEVRRQKRYASVIGLYGSVDCDSREQATRLSYFLRDGVFDTCCRLRSEFDDNVQMHGMSAQAEHVLDPLAWKAIVGFRLGLCVARPSLIEEDREVLIERLNGKRWEQAVLDGMRKGLSEYAEETLAEEHARLANHVLQTTVQELLERGKAQCNYTERLRALNEELRQSVGKEAERIVKDGTSGAWTFDDGSTLPPRVQAVVLELLHGEIEATTPSPMVWPRVQRDPVTAERMRKAPVEAKNAS